MSTTNPNIPQVPPAPFQPTKGQPIPPAPIKPGDIPAPPAPGVHPSPFGW